MEERGVLSALRLNHGQLPYYLKQCSAYCSFFPNDYGIDRKRLMQLWIALGFIQPLIVICVQRILVTSISIVFYEGLFFSECRKDDNDNFFLDQMKVRKT